MSDKFHRRSIRLKGYDYANPNWYYVTICTHQKTNLFGEIKNGVMYLNQFGEIAATEWLNTKQIRENVDLDCYVIMPDHLHGIIIIEQYGRGVLQYAPTISTISKIKQTEKPAEFKSPSQTLGAIIRGYKSTVTKKINDLRIHPANPFGNEIIMNE